MGAPTVPLATTGYAGLGAGQIVSAPVASAPLWSARLTTPTLLDLQLSRTVWSTVLLDREQSRPEWPPMLPELPRTSLRPEPSPLQPSQLPQHHTPPSHQLQETSDLPQLILSPRPESLPQSDPTPESPPR